MLFNSWMSLLGFACTSTLLFACNTDPATQDPVLELRADAVTPPAKVKVSWTLDGVKTEKYEVEPGTKFNLSKVKVGTKVVFAVVNVNDAGGVRANILTENCFRHTAFCGSAWCSAVVEYVVTDAVCDDEIGDSK